MKSGKDRKPGSGKHHSPKPQRKPSKKEEDRTAIMQMLRRGMTKPMIAERLGISKASVYADYKVVVTELRRARTDATDELIEIKLAEYAEIKAEAWEAWERSKLEHQKIAEERAALWTQDEDGNRTRSDELAVVRVVDTRERQIGDTSFLRVVLECLAAERELQCLNPAKELRVKGHMTTVAVDWDLLAANIQQVTSPLLVDEVERRIMEELQRVDAALPDAQATPEALPIQPPTIDAATPSLQEYPGEEVGVPLPAGLRELDPDQPQP